MPIRTWTLCLLLFVSACGSDPEAAAQGEPTRDIGERLRTHAELASEAWPPSEELTEKLVVGQYEQDVRWLVNLLSKSGTSDEASGLTARHGSTLHVERDHTFRVVRASVNKVLGRGKWRIDGKQLHLSYPTYERVGTLHGDALRVWDAAKGQGSGITTWRRR